jgi:hypothetical protein
VDETAYRAARGLAVPLACVFEKAIAAGCATCATSARRALAEREAIGCTSPTAWTNCATLAALLQERATFALKLAPGAALPHAVALRLGCGGLAGVRACVEPGQTDVHRVVVAAQQRFGSLIELPWHDVVASIVAWRIRKRSTGGP